MVAMAFDLGDNRLYLFPLLLALAATGYGFLHARRLHIKEYDVDLPATRSGKSLKAVSYTHLLVSDQLADQIGLKEFVTRLRVTRTRRHKRSPLRGGPRTDYSRQTFGAP